METPQYPNRSDSTGPNPRPAASASAGGDSAPRDETESRILAIWRSVLGADWLGMEDDFLRAGGHSLLALRIAANVETALRVPVSVDGILAARTPRSLSAAVERARGAKLHQIPPVSRDLPIPLSGGQLALWIEHKFDPGDAAFHVPLAVRLAGPLDRGAMQTALGALVSRHEALRTRFIDGADGPAQVVDESPRLAIEVREERDRSAGEIREILRSEARRPFDLGQAPPYRFLLLATGVAEHYLLCTFHHIVVDEWSLGVLTKELGTLYSAAQLGLPADLPAPALQMPDVAAWVHGRESPAPSIPEDEEEFTDSGLPPPFTPADGPTSARVELELPTALGQGLLEGAAREDVTPFELALAAFTVLVRRLTGRDRVTVGTPRTLREGAGFEGLVGYLLDIVGISADGLGGRTYREVVAEIRRRARAPLTARSKPAGSRPFDVMFVFLHDPADRPRLRGIEVSPVPVWTGDAKYALGFEICLRSGRLTCTVEFRRDLVCEEVATSLPRRYAALLEWLLGHPDRSTAEAPSLSDPERGIILDDWNATERTLPDVPSIHRLFERQAARAPNRIAAEWGKERLTYAQLDALANRIARRLVASGVAPGDRVPLLLGRTPQLLAAMLGILKAGAAYAQLDPMEPESRRADILADLAPPLLLTDSILAAQARPSTLRHIFLDDPQLGSLTSEPLTHDGSLEDPAYVMFTSGSTGRPKGVVVPHRAVIRLVIGQDFARLDEGRTWLHLAPGWFDASTMEIWAALLHGGRSVVFPDSVPSFSALARTIREFGVDSLWLTSSLFNAVVDQDPNLLAGLEQLLIGGEILSPRHVRKARRAFPSLRIVNGYGPTENATFTTCHIVTDDDLENAGGIPIGRPIANTQVYILDIDGQLAPVGVPGELCAAGMGLALGYLALPEVTAGRFVRDPRASRPDSLMYRTGDLARWRPDGVLEFRGRHDRQIKLRGFRIELGEIESALARHPAVQSAVVDVRAPDGAPARIIAWCVPRTGAPGPSAEELRQHVEALVPKHMVPSEFVTLAELPLSTSGKLARHRLPMPSRPPVEDEPARLTELKPIERRLLRIWSEVLGTKAIGPDDDFFALGGTSLLAIRMIARVEAEFGRRLPVRTVFAAPTIRTLAPRIQNDASPTLPPAIVLLRDGTSGIPLFCVPGLGGHVFTYRLLLEHLPADRPIYGLQVQELGDRPEVFESIENLARELVSQMRSVRPNGPYYVLGYSFGGNVTFEMARQLEAEGESDGLLMLVDSYPPDTIQPRRGFAKLRVHLLELSRLKPRKMWEYVAERVSRRLFGASPESPSLRVTADSPLQERVARVERWCRSAIDRYAGGTLHRPLVLLRALRLSDWLFLDPTDSTCGWGRFVRGRVLVQEIDCEHLQVFREPHITELGRLIHGQLLGHDDRMRRIDTAHRGADDRS